MAKFRMRPMDSKHTVIDLFKGRDTIDLDPPYQRIGNIWPESMRQFFIDSLVNEVDIPKIYLHEFTPARRRDDGSLVRYAVIDGKQRLQAMWDYINGMFTLADDFVFFDEPNNKEMQDLGYKELGSQAPTVRSRLDRYQLPIILVETKEEQVIDDLFNRLNQSANLNAPEHRNALGGPLREVIKDLSAHKFFRTCIPFENGRYRYYDLAAKFLWIADENSFTSTKRKALDDLVIRFREHSKAGVADASEEAIKVLKEKVAKRLDQMADFFKPSDILLSSITMLHLFFHMVRLEGSGAPLKWNRRWFEALADETRQTNENRRKLIAEPHADVSLDPELLRFITNQQSLNDGVKIEDSYRIMASWISQNFGKAIPLA